MKLQPHSDLACESSRLAGISGGRTVTRTIGGVRITDIRIPEQERRIRPGRYITLEGDLAGSPRVNVALLLFGTMLSSLVGTTGASMLMVRPVIKMNSWRKRIFQKMVGVDTVHCVDLVL